jgi:hypothetical protein
MSTYETLSTYEQWMVGSNLKTIRETDVIPAEQAARLRANGYPRIADAVEESFTDCPRSARCALY